MSSFSWRMYDWRFSFTIDFIFSCSLFSSTFMESRDRILFFRFEIRVDLFFSISSSIRWDFSDSSFCNFSICSGIFSSEIGFGCSGFFLRKKSRKLMLLFGCEGIKIFGLLERFISEEIW